MNDSKEAEIQQELEKISKDIKSIMKKVEELYPKDPVKEEREESVSGNAGVQTQDSES